MDLKTFCRFGNIIYEIAQRSTLPPGPEGKEFPRGPVSLVRRSRATEIETPPLLVYSCPNFRDRGEQDLEGRKTRRRFSFPPQLVRKHGLLKKKKRKSRVLKEAEDETTRRFPRMKESLFIRR